MLDLPRFTMYHTPLNTTRAPVLMKYGVRMPTRRASKHHTEYMLPRNYMNDASVTLSLFILSLTPHISLASLSFLISSVSVGNQRMNHVPETLGAPSSHPWAHDAASHTRDCRFADLQVETPFNKPKPSPRSCPSTQQILLITAMIDIYYYLLCTKCLCTYHNVECHRPLLPKLIIAAKAHHTCSSENGPVKRPVLAPAHGLYKGSRGA